MIGERAGLVADLKALVAQLEDDIRARIGEVPELRAHLADEHRKATAAQRTAMSVEEWREGEITQAAVAWVLACVFVRFMEDNGLIDSPLISGAGDRRTAALGHREEHFREHPEHSDREYLESVFGRVASHSAVAPLYDRRHNPLWRLGPTADGARELREFWTRIDPDTGALAHDFSDPALGTRFLGDLYQDLSETAQKRYALLQTPEFVEEFILDRTLDPAIDEFGLHQVRMIDPTCGSGHFLIGAFERLFTRWRDWEPGIGAEVLAQRALDAVYGVDLNPFATAIARFRLLVTALRACAVRRLSEAPDFRLNLATGDSLLHGAEPGQFEGFGHYREGIRHVFETEDAAELQRILGQGYHAVVGNPPYITGDDEALREAYRRRYHKVCHREFAMTVPFMERFFELAYPSSSTGECVLAGLVGQITGNNFMKREFGVKLVRDFLPTVDLQVVLDASGAYIPGHGTPTILLFGRARPPAQSEIRLVTGIRGEPTTPENPCQGRAWSELVRAVDAPGFEGEFARSSDRPRAEFGEHPWMIGPGAELAASMATEQSSSLSCIAADVGSTGRTSLDDVMVRPASAWRRRGVSRNVASLVTGDSVRDWAFEEGLAVWMPYSAGALGRLLQPEELHGELRALWPWRTSGWARRTFGKVSYREERRPWYEWHQIALRRRTPFSIAWGEVTSHNHFALDRNEKSFSQTAPIIKLPPEATEEDHLALLGVLNSSTACFWLKQVCQGKGNGGIGGGIGDESWEPRYAFNATKVKGLPLPAHPPTALARARELDRLATERAGLLDGLAEPDAEPLADRLAALHARDDELSARMVALQEELDWQMLAAFELVPEDLTTAGRDFPPLALGQRALEIVLARQVAAGEVETTWFERHHSTPITEPPADWPEEYRDLVLRRIELIENDPNVGLIERPEHKRRWAREPWQDRQRKALTAWVLDALEAADVWSAITLRSTAQLADVVRQDPRLTEAVELLGVTRDADIATTVERLVLDAAVPHPATLRLTEKGLQKRSVWERVWDLQRQEDRIDARRGLPDDDPRHLSEDAAELLKRREVGEIPVPPRYAKADFRSATAWSFRGKLDVPKERFVLVPGAEREGDSSPVLGWAGWDERDLARALAERIILLREHEAADSGRLAPLLAGVLELLPWIHQWHPEAETAYGGTAGAFFDMWLDQQLSELALTRDDLRGWRPAAPVRGRRRARVAA